MSKNHESRKFLNGYYYNISNVQWSFYPCEIAMFDVVFFLRLLKPRKYMS